MANEFFDPLYSSDTVYRGQDDTRCITDDLDAIETDIRALESGKSDTNHTHTGFAATSHTHSAYADVDHEHSEYSLTSHTHAGYASEVHTHTEYASASDVAQLQVDVSSKANVSHDHEIDSITGLSDELNSKYVKPASGVAKTDLSAEVQASLTKADTALQSVDFTGYATESYVNSKVANIVDSAPETLDTLNELAAALGDDPNFATTVATQIGGKVDKVNGKGLSTNDYTTAEKNKLASVQEGAEANQNAFSNITVGSTTISADGKTDTLTLVAGSNVTITPDATNDKVTIAATNTVYSHPTTSGNKHIPSGGSSGQILRWSADGTATWGADNNTTYSVATTSANGLMSSADKTKLNGIAEGANKYTLPTASSSTLGGVKTTSTVTSNSGYTACPIISGVPYYKDTNTTYSLSSFGLTATSAELNYVDGVTSNIQTQLNGKAASSHNHSASNITSGTLPIARGGTGATSAAGILSNLGISDFVVAQGQSGNTYYRKWNSGILEQWYQVVANNQAINSAYGSMYIGSHKWTFPVAFTSVDTVLCSCFRWGTGASWGGVTGATNTYADLRGYDLFPRTAGGDTCNIAAYAQGRWK